MFYSFSRTGNSHALETPAVELKVFPKDKHPYYEGDRALAASPNRGRQFGTRASCSQSPANHPSVPCPGAGPGATGRKCHQSPLSQFSASVLELSDSATETAASFVPCTVPGRAAALPTSRRFFVAHREGADPEWDRLARCAGGEGGLGGKQRTRNPRP